MNGEQTKCVQTWLPKLTRGPASRKNGGALDRALHIYFPKNIYDLCQQGLRNSYWRQKTISFALLVSQCCGLTAGGTCLCLMSTCGHQHPCNGIFPPSSWACLSQTMCTLNTCLSTGRGAHVPAAWSVSSTVEVSGTFSDNFFGFCSPTCPF